MEIIIVGAIIIFVLIYNNTIDKDKFIADNQKYLEGLKEDDYQFLVYARYGEEVDIDQLFSKRVSYAFIAFLVVLVLTISNNNSAEIINSQFFLNMILSTVVAFGVFKMPYIQLKLCGLFVGLVLLAFPLRSNVSLSNLTGKAAHYIIQSKYETFSIRHMVHQYTHRSLLHKLVHIYFLEDAVPRLYMCTLHYFGLYARNHHSRNL